VVEGCHLVEGVGDIWGYAVAEQLAGEGVVAADCGAHEEGLGVGGRVGCEEGGVGPAYAGGGDDKICEVFRGEETGD